MNFSYDVDEFDANKTTKVDLLVTRKADQLKLEQKRRKINYLHIYACDYE